MRHARALVLGLLAGLLAGCAGGPTPRANSWFERFHAAQAAADSDVVQLDLALLERPVGDPYVNGELWSYLDEQVIPIERKLALEENGFRLGEVGGVTPAELQSMLTSKRSNPAPRRQMLHAGNSTSLPLGPLAARCRFHVQQGDQVERVSLEQAEYTFDVRASLTEDGKTRLRFTPQIPYGERVLTPEASVDGSGLVLQQERPKKSYSSMAWEVTLAPNHYVVIGARIEHPDSLGYQYFVRRDEPAPVQRLLVIRTARGVSDALPELAADQAEENPSGRRMPALALQAAWTTPPAGNP